MLFVDVFWMKGLLALGCMGGLFFLLNEMKCSSPVFMRKKTKPHIGCCLPTPFGLKIKEINLHRIIAVGSSLGKYEFC
jgi:hypothetical protein